MTSGKWRKKGQLSPEDRALWAQVTKTLTPLSQDRTVADDPDETNDGSPDKKAPSRKTKTATAIRAPRQPDKPPPPPPLHRLDNRYRRKLVRGVKSIDARIDLHGLTQHQAHERLRGFLFGAQAHGCKLVLVITGKGGSGQGFMDERGVLRRVVPQWLAMPDMRSIVLGYEEAHVTHGGSGALYVRIRRRRENP
jgi:DNA-nicking Smr family endonuclease